MYSMSPPSLINSNTHSFLFLHFHIYELEMYLTSGPCDHQSGLEAAAVWLSPALFTICVQIFTTALTYEHDW